MTRGRIAFWLVAAAVAVGAGGFHGWRLWSATDRSDNGEDSIEVMKRERDVPPEPWLSPDPWWKAATIDAYDKANAGRIWPGARRAVVAYAKMASRSPERTDDEREDAQLAISLGREFQCDEPLVRYVQAKTMPGPEGREPTAGGWEMTLAARSMKTRSDYPPLIRADALLRAAAHAAFLSERSARDEEKNRAESQAFLVAAELLYPAVAADHQTPLTAFAVLLEGLGTTVTRMNVDRQEAFSKLLSALEKERWPTSTLETLKGIVWTDYAWDARGFGYANTVSETAWRLFAQRLKQARAALTKAWEADHSNATAAEWMITVCMGDGAERAEMEQWYARAMAADPACSDAVHRKIEFLQPRWGGSTASMVLFGRELTQLADDPRTRRLPLLLAWIHWDLSKRPMDRQPDPGYFADNPDCWSDVSRVYDRYLAQVPGARYHRTRYAVTAAWAGHWDVAGEQFRILGDRYHKDVLYERYLKVLRDRALKEGDKSNPSPTQPAAATPG